jgi:hypothetical protein
MGATEMDRRRSGPASAAAERGLDVADHVIERCKPRGRGRSGGGSKVLTPVGLRPTRRVGAFAVATGGRALAIEDEIGREPSSRKLARGETAGEVRRRHDARFASRVSTALGSGTPGTKQGFVVAGEAGDSGDRAVQGGEAVIAGALSHEQNLAA